MLQRRLTAETSCDRSKWMVWCFTLSIALAFPLRAEQPQTEGLNRASTDKVSTEAAGSRDEEDVAGTNDKETDAQESIAVRYARAHLELAKLDLRRALEWNDRIPNLFTERELDSLRKHVEIDREQLKQSQRGYETSVYQVMLRTAETTVDSCLTEVSRRQEIYQASQNRFNAMELDHAIARLKVAKLNLARTMSQKESISTIAFLQWQIDELRNQLMEVQLRLDVEASDK